MVLAKEFDLERTPLTVSQKAIVMSSNEATGTRHTSESGYFYSYYIVSDEPPETYLAAEDYPVLAEVWDNEADSIYDDLQ